MTKNESADSTARLMVDNIGGIDHTEIELTPGLNVLTGENATNRTSLLLALNEVLGGDMGNVRFGAEGGRVELEIGEQTFFRTLSPMGRGFDRGGNQYCDDPNLVNLFATLIERNKIRSLIETQDRQEINEELADLVMAPVDDKEIRRRISTLKDERDKKEAKLEDLREAKATLPQKEQQLEEKKQELEETEEELEEVKKKHEEKRAEMDEIDVDRKDEETVSDILDERDEVQKEISTTKDRIRRREESIEESKQKIEEYRSKLESVKEELEGAESPNSSRINELQARKNELEQLQSFLDSIDRTNERVINENLPEELLADDSATGSHSPADDHEINCPTCGSTVEKGSVRDRMVRIRKLASEYGERAEEVGEKLEELRNRQSNIDDLEQRQKSYENTIADSEHKVDTFQNELEEDREKLEQLESKLEGIEERLEEAKQQRTDEYKEIANEAGDLQTKENELERKVNTLQADVDTLQAEIKEMKETVGDEDKLQEELDEINDQLESLRGRVRATERRAADAMNNHMDNLLEVMDYENIARIRFDHQAPADPNKRGDFEMIITRENEEGVGSVERNVTTLSESERSLIGLVVALAGYITHRVEDEVPFLIFDSIEQFDSSRIDRLLSYVGEELDVDYMVAALLPEDADGISTAHTEIGSEKLIA